MNKIVFFFILVLLLSSCNRPPKDVRMVLRAAGNNRPELEKVITRYSKSPADSLKLKAAYFLIENMIDKYYYVGELLNNYYRFVEVSVKNEARNKAILDSIEHIYGPFSKDLLDIKYDVKELSGQFIINNIDMAFKVWHERPWGKDISFDQFCEYILPYRAGNEIPNFDREVIYNQFNFLLDSICNAGSDAVTACCLINNVLIRSGFYFTHEISFLPPFSAMTLLNQQKGNCREMTAKALFIMRALGIPVTIDFTPQKADWAMGHDWNIVLDKNGENHVFMGMESNPGKPHLERWRYAKIYRRTCERQKESLATKRGRNDIIPPLFYDAHIKDVTDEYFKTSEIEIRVKGQMRGKGKYGFICVFDNEKWVPVGWAATINNDILFTKTANENIVCLPAFYENGQLVPVKSPLILSKNGDVTFLIADRNNLHDMNLYRKFPTPSYAGNMSCGKFQGANSIDFKNPYDIYTIPPNDSLIWQEIEVKIPRAFRYYRYLGPDSSYGEIAEFELYENNNKVKGNGIGVPGKWKDPVNIYNKVGDGDVLTYFRSDKPTGLGLD